MILSYFLLVKITMLPAPIELPLSSDVSRCKERELAKIGARNLQALYERVLRFIKERNNRFDISSCSRQRLLQTFSFLDYIVSDRETIPFFNEVYVPCRRIDRAIERELLTFDLKPSFRRSCEWCETFTHTHIFTDDHSTDQEWGW